MANIDTSKFECFRSRIDGSIYYGQLAIVDKVTKLIVNETEQVKILALPAADF